MKMLLTYTFIITASLTITNCTTELHQEPTPTTTTTERTTLSSPYLGGGSVQTQTTQTY